MSEWIIGIGAIVIITTIIGYVLPNDKLGKYIKGVFSVLILLVVIKPIINFDFNELSSAFDVDNDIYSYQDDYINYVFDEKNKSLVSDVNTELEKIGVCGSDIKIRHSISKDFLFVIKKITINLQKAVINVDKENIDIIEEIKNVVSQYLYIENDLIEIVQ